MRLTISIRYEESKRQAAKEVAGIRKQWVATRERLDERASDRAQGGRAKVINVVLVISWIKRE